ncbi:hypothetical protein QWJ34_19850 [Saccharibacillus sp. CPCC 101409]|uniref:hypothetical protein n=1 Tax=Saccharibacillus sp. CPCC 101409 TaxID=3058041 RepID=UPI002672F84C|nr:hypothetical protein [Saccharibacillus sp. CPCC 101409]MDO3412026.1 hypothetical protein [Saccharibacillus sp. CPCC 101409]
MLIVILYIITAALVAAPLLLILKRREFQQYFVYFIAASGFLFLNVIGSVSRNVTAYGKLSFYIANLAIACAFAAFYPVIRHAASTRQWQTFERRFSAIDLNTSWIRTYVRLLGTIAAVSLLLFFIFGALPLIFRFDLFGDWGLLIQARTAVVSLPGFYWISLGLFEIPLFLTIVLGMMRLLDRDRQSAESLYWRKFYRIVVFCSLLGSILYLNKQYLMYLLAAVLLVRTIADNRLSLKRLFSLAAAAFGSLFFLYWIYLGQAAVKFIAQTVFHRLFEVYAWGGAVAFWLFPEYISFLHGTSFVNPDHLFPYRQIRVDLLIYPFIYKDQGGNAPLAAIYENYVNFGWWGICIGIVLMLLAIWIITLLSWSPEPFYAWMAVYLSIKTLLLWQAPFWFGLFDPTLCVFLICLFIGKWIVSRENHVSRRLLADKEREG